MTNSYASLSNEVDSSLLRSPNDSRLYFDQRLTSKVAQSVVPLTPNKEKINVDIEEIHGYTKMNWVNLGKIFGKSFDLDNFDVLYGEITTIECSGKFLAIGTSKCHILLFSYQEELIQEIKTPNGTSEMQITTLAISHDSTYVAAGYSSGLINLWDLQKSLPIISILPVSIENVQHNGNHFSYSHLEGTPVRQLSFIGARHTALLSLDDSGMLFRHNGTRALFKFYCNTSILAGMYNIAYQRDLNFLTQFSMLPLGSHKIETDHMGLIATITQNGVSVISTKPAVETKFRIIRNKEVTDSIDDITSFVKWFPATENRTDGIITPPMLAYCWSNVLNVKDVSIVKLKNKFNELTWASKLVNHRKVSFLKKIVFMDWLNNKLLITIDEHMTLFFVDAKSMKILKTNDLSSHSIRSPSKTNFLQTIKCFKQNLIFLEEKYIAIGNLYIWSDVLMGLFNLKEFNKALEMACIQYKGTCELGLIGLSEDDNIRHKLVKEYIVKIFPIFMNYLFSEKANAEINLIEKRNTYALFLSNALETCATIDAPFDIYDEIYELYTENDYEELFFEELEPFLLSCQISKLPPLILKSMVAHYINNSSTSILEQLICTLDIYQLDIDLAMSLCKQYHLHDSLSYISTLLLGDFLTPIFDALLLIKESNESNYLTAEEKYKIHCNVAYVYPFMSYSLTGRHYPTEKNISFETLKSAKLSIYNVLFSGSSIIWPLGSDKKFHMISDYNHEAAFPYLNALLKFDPKSFFACLNEAFEDSILNDDAQFDVHINRQYVVDILWGMHNDTNCDLSFVENIYLCVFIARNYPKYKQFINISESVADKIIDVLCDAGIAYKAGKNVSKTLKIDCEISVRSLLSIYKPLDIEYLLLTLNKAGFWGALVHVWKSEKMWYELLNFWVKMQDTKDKPARNFTDDPFTDFDDYDNQIISNEFSDIPVMVGYALSVNKRIMVDLIGKNIDIFIKSDPRGMAKIIMENCPELNKFVGNITTGRVEYLREVFELKKRGASNVHGSLNTEYLECLISQLDSTHDKKKAILELKEFVEHLPLNEFQNVLLNGNDDTRDLLTDMFVFHSQWDEAIQLGFNNIRDVLKDQTEDRNDRVWRFFTKIFEILQSSDPVLDKSEGNVTKKDLIYLKILEFTVGLFKSAHYDLKDTDDLFKQLVQYGFTQIMNIQDSDHFSTIFKTFLENSSINATKVSDVSDVLSEIFLAYKNDEFILILIQKLVNDDVFKDLVFLENLKKRGWVVHLNCEICGKKLWGKEIDDRIFEIYKEHQLSEVSLVADKGKELYFENLRLCSFKCGHTYHVKCINGKKCVLCD